jgi:hypothetical protein
MQAMIERERRCKAGRAGPWIEIDDAYIVEFAATVVSVNDLGMLAAHGALRQRAVVTHRLA